MVKVIFLTTHKFGTIIAHERRRIFGIKKYPISRKLIQKMGRLQSINSSSFLRYNYSRTQTTPAAKTTQAAMFYYTYDNAYNLTAMTTYTAASGNDNFEYQYDLNGNQVKKSFRHRDASQYVTTNYSYDALNRLESEQHHDGTVTSYSFDLNSNIKSKEISGETSYKFTQDGTDYELTNIPQHNITYAYDKNNRMQSQMEIVTGTGANFGGRVESISSYAYDANGNMLKKETGGQTDERVVEYVYNALNQLTEAKKDGVTVGSYTYDGTGMRRSKTVNGVKTKFYWDRGNIINEAKGGTITADNLFGPDGIISRSEGGQVNYYYKDGHGDVYYSHPWDDYNPYLEGTYYDYDAYGNQKISNDDDTNPFRYCGEYYDLSSGLIYLRNRDYDPSVGRFTQQDDPKYMRIGYPETTNLYIYCFNNPIRYTDPWGNDPPGKSYFIAIFAGINTNQGSFDHVGAEIKKQLLAQNTNNTVNILTIYPYDDSISGDTFDDVKQVTKNAYELSGNTVNVMSQEVKDAYGGEDYVYFVGYSGGGVAASKTAEKLGDDGWGPWISKVVRVASPNLAIHKDNWAYRTYDVERPSEPLGSIVMPRNAEYNHRRYRNQIFGLQGNPFNLGDVHTSYFNASNGNLTKTVTRILDIFRDSSSLSYY